MENPEALIDPLHLEDLRNELHPSIFDENETYDMLIVRLPVIGHTLDASSLGFVITSSNSYLYNKNDQLFELLDDRFEGPYKVIDALADLLLKSFSGYQDMIADMEELLYQGRPAEDFMTRWMELKRDILRVERILLRSSVTLKAAIEYYEEAKGFPINSYADLHEHMERTMRAAGLQLSKLDYLYSFYNVRTNEKMNKMIYILTIISAVFLPLNLVVGFFGMNTGGLPFAEGASGTFKAVLLMFSLVIITSGILLYLWKRRVEKR
jgi:magnesium transporter